MDTRQKMVISSGLKSDASLLRFVDKKGLVPVFAVFVLNAFVDLLMTTAIASSLAKFLGDAAGLEKALELAFELGLERHLYHLTFGLIFVRFSMSMFTTFLLGRYTAQTGERIRSIIFEDFINTNSSPSIEDLIQNVQLNVAGFVNGRLKQWLTIFKDSIVYFAIVFGAGALGGEALAYFLIGVVVALLALRLITMKILALVAKATMQVSYRVTRFLRTFFLLRQEIRIFGRTAWASGKFFVENRRWSTWAVKQDLIIAFTRLLIETSIFSTVMIAIIYATNRAINGDQVLSTIGLLVVVGMRLGPLLVSISQCYTALVSSAPRAFKLYEALAQVKLSDLEIINDTFTEETVWPAVGSKAKKFEGCRYRNPAGREIKVPAFTLSPGNIVCVVGPSGIGKTTFFEDLLGLSTRINLPDEILSFRKTIKNQRIGFCPQFPEVMDGSYRENICLGEDYGPIVDEMFRKFQVSGQPDDLIAADNPSGGERKKLGILRAVCCPGRNILIFDEPSNAMDIKAVKLFCEIIKQQSISVAVVMISHDPRIVECAHETIEFEDCE